MSSTVLITGAGGGGSNNLITSVRKSGLDVNIIGSNCDQYLVCKSYADKTYLLPEATDPKYEDFLIRLLEREKVDLVVPNNDREVEAISSMRSRLPTKAFLPSHETIELCQDKLQFYDAMVSKNLPVAKTVPVTTIDALDAVFDELGERDRYWIRMRRGAGSKGATSLNSKAQAQWWLSYWQEMRGVSPDSFTISEHLPGRDFAFQSVWREGECLVGKCCERLSYVFGANRVSGVSSSPQVGKLIKEPEVIDLCVRTIKAIDPAPHGNFNIDLKCDPQGNPNVTEVNIGRFCMITPIFDLSGKLNTAEIHIRAALGDWESVNDPLDDYPDEDTYLLRELDVLPEVITASEMKRRIEHP